MYCKAIYCANLSQIARLSTNQMRISLVAQLSTQLFQPVKGYLICAHVRRSNDNSISHFKQISGICSTTECKRLACFDLTYHINKKQIEQFTNLFKERQACGLFVRGVSVCWASAPRMHLCAVLVPRKSCGIRLSHEKQERICPALQDYVLEETSR